MNLFLNLFLFSNIAFDILSIIRRNGSGKYTGNSIIKVGTDVLREQNLGLRAKFLQKTIYPGKKVVKNTMIGQVFMNFRVQNRNFSASRPILAHSFIKNCQKPNARAILISQNLMPGQIDP